MFLRMVIADDSNSLSKTIRFHPSKIRLSTFVAPSPRPLKLLSSTAFMKSSCTQSKKGLSSTFINGKYLGAIVQPGKKGMERHNRVSVGGWLFIVPTDKVVLSFFENFDIEGEII